MKVNRISGFSTMLLSYIWLNTFANIPRAVAPSTPLFFDAARSETSATLPGIP
jgi:hypothetical protein